MLLTMINRFFRGQLEEEFSLMNDYENFIFIFFYSIKKTLLHKFSINFGTCQDFQIILYHVNHLGHYLISFVHLHEG